MHFFEKVIAGSAIAVLCHVPAGLATSTTPLRLDDAIRATVEHNPQLSAYRFKTDALAGEQQTAGLRPEYRVGAELENVAGSGELSGIDAAELTIAVSSVIELGAKRDARLGLVTARQQQLQTEQRVLTLDVLSGVTRQFLALVAAQEQLALHLEADRIARDMLTSMRRQVQAGRLAETEVLRAQAGLARTNIALRQAEQAVRRERLLLSAHWADSTPDFQTVEGDLYTVPPSLPLSELQFRLANNPDLLLLASEIDVLSAQLREARSNRRGDIEWSAGVRRFEDSGDSAAVVGLSVPLGSGQRASGAVATATAQQAGAQQAHDSARVRLESELASLVDEQQQASSELGILRNEVIPVLRRALKGTADGFELGRYSYLELTLAQSELLDAQLAVIDAAERVQQTRIELERLTGVALNDKNNEVTQ